MNDKQERLLQDLIRDPQYMAFRAELWQATSAAVQRRRWQRIRNRYLALAACVALFGLLFAGREWLPHGGPVRPSSVRSLPAGLAPGVEIVHTRPSGIELIGTRPWNDSFTTALPNSVAIIHTQSKPGQVPLLSDQDLQDLFQGHPTALVSLTGGRQRLIFLNPVDQARFLVQLATP